MLSGIWGSIARIVVVVVLNAVPTVNLAVPADASPASGGTSSAPAPRDNPSDPSDPNCAWWNAAYPHCDPSCAWDPAYPACQPGAPAPADGGPRNPGWVVESHPGGF